VAAKHVRLLEYIQIGLTLISVASLIAIVAIKILGRSGSLVIPLGVVMMVCGLGITIASRKARPFYPKFEMLKRAIDQKMAQERIGTPNQLVNDGAKDSDTSKIPLTIGFANLSGEDLEAIASEDATALSPLFARSKSVAPHQIPSAEVLFVYAHLNEDGTIQGASSSGIRQVVELTNAAIVILASTNSSPSIQNAIGLPGSKSANLIFTIDRNGDGFGRFFRELFEKMRDGKDMLSAWVELAPQHPNANLSYAPQTVFLAEGGKIAFPH
jgi:hypothetical protein